MTFTQNFQMVVMVTGVLWSLLMVVLAFRYSRIQKRYRPAEPPMVYKRWMIFGSVMGMALTILLVASLIMKSAQASN